MSPYLSLTVLHLRSSGMPFLISLTVPQLIFLSLHKKVQTRKEIVHVQLLATSFYFPSQFCYCGRGCLSSAVTCIVCPSPSKLSCHMCNQSSHKVCTFWCQNTCVSWNYIVWKSPFLQTTQSPHQLPDFLNGCKMWKTSCLEFQICPVFTIACRNFHPSCQLHFCCTWNAAKHV